MLAVATPAVAADPEIRAWDHGQEGQLVLDWGAPVDYQVADQADQVVLSFAEPIGDGLGTELEAAGDKLSDYLIGLSLSEDRKQLTVALAEDLSMDHRSVGGAVILSFQPLPTTEPAAEPAAPSVGIVVQDNDSFSRLTVVWPEPVNYEVDRQSDEVSIRFDWPAIVDPGGGRGDRIGAHRRCTECQQS